MLHILGERKKKVLHGRNRSPLGLWFDSAFFLFFFFYTGTTGRVPICLTRPRMRKLGGHLKCLEWLDLLTFILHESEQPGFRWVFDFQMSWTSRTAWKSCCVYMFIYIKPHTTFTLLSLSSPKAIKCYDSIVILVSMFGSWEGYLKTAYNTISQQKISEQGTLWKDFC